MASIMMRFVLLVLASLLCVIGAGAGRAQFLLPSRADDTEATSGNPSVAPFKWAGLLIVPDPSDKNPNAIDLCTGDFIPPNVVITAGHCLRDIGEKPAGPWPDVSKGTFWLQYQNESGTPFKIICGEV